MVNTKTVFILGAGASRSLGAPLMFDFLEKARRIHNLGRCFSGSNQSFARIFKLIDRLQVVHSKAQFDLYNIEQVFGSIEMALTMGVQLLPDHPNTQLIEDLRTVIDVTLEMSIAFLRDGNQRPLAPGYAAFIKKAKELKEKAKPNHDVSILTFNYDYALEIGCYNNGLEVNYGFEGLATGLAEIDILKLHGSLNWVARRDSPDIGIYDIWRQGWDVLESKSGRGINISIRDKMRREFPSDQWEAFPFLVPPTWSKGTAYSPISKVWSSAAKAFSQADNIYICGYSLPESDAFFRYFYALGTMGEKPLQRIAVFDPCQDDGVERRYRQLLGAGVVSRFKFERVEFDQFPVRIPAD